MPFPNPTDLLEVELEGSSSDRRTLGSVEVHIAASDVRSNAELALKNLVEETTRGVKSSGDELATRVDELVEAGQSAIQSDLSQSFQAAVPGIDNFIQVLDSVADVRGSRCFSIESPFTYGISGSPVLEAGLANHHCSV